MIDGPRMEPPLKLFSIQEADQLLGRIEPLVRRLQSLQQAMAPSPSDEQIEQFEATYQELTATGGLLKDLDLGLVDFYGLHDAAVVCLCWKLGESRIGFWHRLEDGYAGRQPL